MRILSPLPLLFLLACQVNATDTPAVALPPNYNPVASLAPLHPLSFPTPRQWIYPWW